MTKLKLEARHGLRRLFATIPAAGVMMAGATGVSAAELTVYSRLLPPASCWPAPPASVPPNSPSIRPPTPTT